METGRRTQTLKLDTATSSYSKERSSGHFRGLQTELAGVIFGCTHKTMKECLSNNLFGLPASHFAYVQHIQPGMPLFLFNYSDRKIHGVFEAASKGEMNINPYGWTNDGSEKTHYPAQVRVRVKHECQPLLENVFRHIIAANYYARTHFTFELDESQTNTLISQFCSRPLKIAKGIPLSHSSSGSKIQSASHEGKAPNFRDDSDDGNERKYSYWEYEKISKGAALSSCSSSGQILGDSNEIDYEAGVFVPTSQSTSLVDWPPMSSSQVKQGDKLSTCLLMVENAEHLSKRVSQNEQPTSNDSFKSPETICKDIMANTTLENCNDNVSASLIGKFEDMSLEKDIINTEFQNGLRVKSSNAKCLQEHETRIENFHAYLSPPDAFVLKSSSDVSGCQGLSMMQMNQEVELLKRCITFHKESYEELKNRNEQLEHRQGVMEEEIKALKDQVKGLQYLLSRSSIYVLGGYNGKDWLSSVDLYTPGQDYVRNISELPTARYHAAAVILDKSIYIFGGGIDQEFYDTVDCYSVSTGDWMRCPSMNFRRGCLAGVSLCNKIYALGGCCHNEHYSEVEMYDPILGKWLPHGSMLEKRLLLAGTVLGGVIYACGGFNGNQYLKSLERYDPREGRWHLLESMSTKRACLSVAVLNEKLYAIGGHNSADTLSSMEVFDPRADSWFEGQPLHSPRRFGAAAVLDGTIFMIGGEGAQYNIDTVEHYSEGLGWQTYQTTFGQRSLFAAVVED